MISTAWEMWSKSKELALLPVTALAVFADSAWHSRVIMSGSHSLSWSFSLFFFWCYILREIICLVVSGHKHAFKAFENSVHEGYYYESRQDNCQCLECTSELSSPRLKSISKDRPCWRSHFLKPMGFFIYVAESQRPQKSQSKCSKWCWHKHLTWLKDNEGLSYCQEQLRPGS